MRDGCIGGSFADDPHPALFQRALRPPVGDRYLIEAAWRQRKAMRSLKSAALSRSAGEGKKVARRGVAGAHAVAEGSLRRRGRGSERSRRDAIMETPPAQADSARPGGGPSNLTLGPFKGKGGRAKENGPVHALKAKENGDGFHSCEEASQKRWLCFGEVSQKNWFRFREASQDAVPLPFREGGQGSGAMPAISAAEHCSDPRSLPAKENGDRKILQRTSAQERLTRGRHCERHDPAGTEG